MSVTKEGTCICLRKHTPHPYSPHWMTAVGVLDEENFIGAEHQHNVFTVRLRSIVIGVVQYTYIYHKKKRNTHSPSVAS